METFYRFLSRVAGKIFHSDFCSLPMHTLLSVYVYATNVSCNMWATPDGVLSTMRCPAVSRIRTEIFHSINKVVYKIICTGLPDKGTVQCKASS